MGSGEGDSVPVRIGVRHAVAEGLGLVPSPHGRARRARDHPRCVQVIRLDVEHLLLRASSVRGGGARDFGVCALVPRPDAVAVARHERYRVVDEDGGSDLRANADGIAAGEPALMNSDAAIVAVFASALVPRLLHFRRSNRFLLHLRTVSSSDSTHQ